MLPVLLDLKVIKIYTFGVFLVLAFFWSLFWLWRNLKRTSFKEEEIFDGVFVSLIGGFLGARLLYVALHFDKFGFDILKFILVNGYPGLSMIGFLMGGLISLLIFTIIVNISFLEVAAYIVPSLFLALGIGKIGSFFSGSTVGSTTDFLLSVQYLGYPGLRHITAVYEAIIMFAGCIISQRLLMSYRRDSVHEGTLLSFFIIMVGISEMILDNFKHDPVYLGRLPFNVIISGVFVLIFGVWELYKYRDSIISSVIKMRGTRAQK